MNRLRDARSLGAVMRTIIAVTAAAGTAGCGARVDAESDTPGDASTTCRRGAVYTGDSSGCARYQVVIVGDVTTCSTADCAALCGRNVACTIDESTELALCLPGCSLPPTGRPDSFVVDGRRPPLLANAPTAAVDLGSHFARMAFYEAASVHAFAIIARELRAHGAPSSLIRSVQRARLDEVRHAELARALARNYGSEPDTPLVPSPTRIRTPLALALDNAREGCGRELVGAMFGHYQARHAASPDVRAFYARVARDETRHAAVSLRMHDWLMTRLGPRQRQRVLRVWRTAIEASGGPDVTNESLGTPTASTRRRLVTEVARAIAA